MKKNLSYLFVSILFLSFLMTVYLCLQWPDEYMHVITCDVGQGDAILITHGFHQLLVDSGPDETVLECLEKYMPFWDKHIDMVIATHAHADHIGGFSAVIQSFTIDRFVHNPSPNNTNIYQNLIQELQVNSIQEQPMIAGNTVSVFIPKEDVVFQTIWPDETVLNDHLNSTLKHEEVKNPKETSKFIEDDDENSRSISGYLRYKNFTLFLSGDIGSATELSIDRWYSLSDVDVLKVAHHGSKYSTSISFLDKVKPEVALISSGKNNSFGHPHSRVIDLLRSRNIKIFETAQSGDIEIITDGISYWQAGD